jgi:ATP-dependent DNA helicase RecG
MGLQRAFAPAATSQSRSVAPPAGQDRRPAPRAAAKPAAKRAAKNPLTYLQLADPREALLISPARFIDCTVFAESLGEVAPEATAMFRLTLTGAAKGFNSRKQVAWSTPDTFADIARVPRKLFWQTRRMELQAEDGRGHAVTISSFGSPAMWANYHAGDALHVTGSYQWFGRRAYFRIEEHVPEKAIGSVWVKYRHVPGQISAERIALAVATAKLDSSSWRHCAARIVGEAGLPERDLLERIESEFESIEAILRSLHEPESTEAGLLAQEDARRISALAIQAAALRSAARAPHPMSPIAIDPGDIGMLAGLQKETMTDDQVAVVERMSELLSQPKAMTALLSGDVGTGKTLSYLLPAVAAHRAGAKVAIMAPTNLLADQLYQQVVQRFDSSIRGVQRLESGDVIRDPGYILVGTSGLVEAARKSKYVPNVLICDEQHKMGTATREGLQAEWTHVLEVSATPIPRSLATALYDGMEILNLRQSPVKKKIDSYVIDMTQKKDIIDAIRKAIARRERCAFVYPMVSKAAADKADSEDGIDEEQAEENAIHTVESAYEGLNSLFPGKVVKLHGQMSQDELRQGIAQMRSGERLIMVASTVIETGLDIPSISLMVVRNADRFGVSQLHQLRGRLVRNGGEGNFLMAVESFEDFPSKDDGTVHETLQRLDAVASTTDGYELAERDLLLRGFGDFSGLDQTGAAKTVFRLVDLKIEDFMARKLKTLRVEPTVRPNPKNIPAQAEPVLDESQRSLFG